MLTKPQTKLITSLARKKYRHEHRLFLVEGRKSINEFLESSYQLHSLFTTDDFFNSEKNKTFLVSSSELKRISQLSTPQVALAVFHIKETPPETYKNLVLALDGVRDPGNMGTIIRLCDWFGVGQLICSEDCVDCYNPKVVQATMGSLSRVEVIFLNLKKYLEEAPAPVNVYGSFLSGANVYQQNLASEAILVMGNEANGISSEVEKIITQRINIPQFGNATESLNVATATSILLSEFKRSGFTGK